MSDAVVADDGVQFVELVGDDVVFLFDAREIGTGRFHPPRLELRADGTGRLQNSDNAPDGTAIGAGSEYITDLAFDPGNTMIFGNFFRATGRVVSTGGGGALSPVILWCLGLAGVALARRRSCG